MIVHPHPDLVNAYDPQYGIARLSDRREAPNIRGYGRVAKRQVPAYALDAAP